MKILEAGGVQELDRWSIHGITAHGPERVEGLSRERRGIEPLCRALGDRIGVADKVRAVAAARVGAGRRVLYGEGPSALHHRDGIELPAASQGAGDAVQTGAERRAIACHQGPALTTIDIAITGI